MALRVPPSGRQVKTGRLRVDAARAIAKLRQYQLAEPAAWILEAIRAAVASGATKIFLQGDSNDIWLRWNGPVWKGEELTDLLSALVSPESAQDGPWQKLLATAINSALGLPTSYLDLYRIEDGAASKVRFSPSVLAAPSEAGELSGLEQLALQEVLIPERAQGSAMFLHLRRRLGLDPLRNLWRGESREMAIARQACKDLAVPIVIGDEQFGPDANSTDLLRIPLEGIDGFLALLRHDEKRGREAWVGETQMEIAEHGVHIVSYPVQVSAKAHHPRPVPLRFYVNGPRMPTNASHSEVRRNEHPVRSAETQLPKLFEALCETLHDRLQSEASPELRDAAVWLLAAWIAGPSWPQEAHDLPEELRRLAGLPLLNNAVGVPRSFLESWNPLQTHAGKEGFSDKFSSWLTGTLWAPVGSPERSLVDCINSNSLSPVIRTARKQIRARERFMSHAARPITLEREANHWITMPIDTSWASEEVTSLTGEIALLRSGTRSRIIILHKGREIEEVEFPSEIPFVAIVAGELAPAHDYKSVLRDASYREMVTATRSAVISCVATLCDASESGAEATRMCDLVQGSLCMAAALESPEEILRSSPLSAFPAWPLDGGRWASLAELRREDVVGLASKPRSGPPGRVIVLLGAPERRAHLERLLEGDCKLVDYTEHSYPDSNKTITALTEFMEGKGNGSAVLSFANKEVRGAISFGHSEGEAVLEIYHCGVSIATQYWHGEVAVHIAIDSDLVVPSKYWLEAGGLDDDALATQVVALARALAAAYIGHSVPGLKFEQCDPPIRGFVGRSFAKLIHTSDNISALLGDDLLAQL